MGNTELMNANGTEQVRVTWMKRSDKKRRELCANEEVCSNLLIKNRKNSCNGRRR